MAVLMAHNQDLPPTERGLRCRPLLLALLCFQSVFSLLRGAVLMDISGAFVTTITTLVGWKAWVHDMNISWIVSWGVMCFVNGLFDTARVADYLAHVLRPGNYASANFLTNLVNLLAVTMPVWSLLGAMLSWYLYNDYAAQIEASHSLLPMGPAGGSYYGALGNPSSSSTSSTSASGSALLEAGGATAAMAGAAAGDSCRAADASKLTPFAGRGRRLLD
mmetsp:Transcript_90446/g.198112  ORF Transcript_90446/g.198112 Transcript_90446/m.198112 type:complete len:219 (-) Transcript_90446:55-711(-)